MKPVAANIAQSLEAMSTKDSEKKAAPGFAEMMQDMVKNVNDKQVQGDETLMKHLEGKAGLHEAMLSMTEADLSMRLLLKVRNKLLDAYKEVMRMPL